METPVPGLLMARPRWPQHVKLGYYQPGLNGKLRRA